MPPGSARGYLDIQIVGDDKGVQLLLRRLELGFSPVRMAGFLQSTVGPWLQERAKMRFKGEGDDVVGKWQPLKAATQDIRANGPWAVGPAHPINIRTREMEDYVTGSAGDAVPMGYLAQLTFPDPKRGASKSLQDKMKTAQKGSPKPRTVARPVIGLGLQDLTFVMAELAFYTKQVGRGVRV